MQSLPLRIYVQAAVIDSPVCVQQKPVEYVAASCPILPEVSCIAAGAALSAIAQVGSVPLLVLRSRLRHGVPDDA